MQMSQQLQYLTPDTAVAIQKTKLQVSWLPCLTVSQTWHLHLRLVLHLEVKRVSGLVFALLSPPLT